MKTTISTLLLLAGFAALCIANETEESQSNSIRNDQKNKEEGSAKVTPGVLQIFEPTKPKPVGVVPSGWVLKVLPDHQAQSTPVLLENGKEAEILSTPFVLEPDAEAGRVSILEPGYEVARGIAQSNTLAGLLAGEVERGRETDVLLAATLEGLEAVLATLEAKPKQ